MALSTPVAVRGIRAAHAAGVWYVATGGVDSSSCGTSAAQPCRTIGQAISNAGAGDTISIAPGMYHELVTIGKNLTLQGAGTSTIVDGSGLSGSVVTVGTMPTGPSTAEPTATLRGLTIQHGSGTDVTGVVAGGGILNWGSLTVIGCTISNNAVNPTAPISGGVVAFGGGIFSSGTLTVTGSTVSNNSLTLTATAASTDTGAAALGLGGGIAVISSQVVANGSTTSLVVNGSTVSANRIAAISTVTAGTSNTSAGSEALGGGIGVLGAGLTVSGSTVSNNTLTANSAGNAGNAAKNNLGLFSVSEGGGILAIISSLTAAGDTISGNSVAASTTGSAQNAQSAAIGGGIVTGLFGIGLLASTPASDSLLGQLAAHVPALGKLLAQQPSAAPSLAESVSNSTISNNTTGSSSAATATGVTVAVSIGGGIANSLPVKGAMLSFSGNIVSGNTASGSAPTGEADVLGGGIVNSSTFFGPVEAKPGTASQTFQSYLHALGSGLAGALGVRSQDGIAASMAVNGSIISGNTASTSARLAATIGGGIANLGAGMTVANSTISGNNASGGASALESETIGGGIANMGGLEASNLTITGNAVHGATNVGALVGGGGVAGGETLLTNDTINANSVIGPASIAPDGIRANIVATPGGGLLGSAVVANTIIAGNTFNGAVANCSNTNSNQHGNLEDVSPGTCGFSTANGDVVGQDPQLGPLQDNGSVLVGPPGSTALLFTEAIPLTSPAANLGVALTCEGLIGPDGVTADTDERGLPRHSTLRGHCDSGAYDTGDDITLPATIAGAVNAVAPSGIRLGFAASSSSSFPVGYVTLLKPVNLPPVGIGSLVATGPLTLDCPDQCVGTSSIPVPGTVTLTITGIVSRVQGMVFAIGDTVKATITFTNSRLGTGAGSTFRQALVKARVQVFAPGSATPLLDTTVAGPYNPQSKVSAVPAS